MSGSRHSLRRRIVAAFIVFALATALCFSAFSVIFVYTVEDSFFDNMLRQEASHQRQAGGVPVKPLRDFVSIHRDNSQACTWLAQKGRLAKAWVLDCRLFNGWPNVAAFAWRSRAPQQ